MIENAITAIQTRLLELCPEHIAYLAEDWGQIDFYNERPPVNFPCVLLDIAEAEFADLSRKVQHVEAVLTVRIAHFDPVNVSAQAPDRDKAFRIFGLLRTIYASLQGFAGEGFSGLTRTSLRRIKRDDAIREYAMEFRLAGTDSSAHRPNSKAEGIGLELTVQRS